MSTNDNAGWSRQPASGSLPSPDRAHISTASGSPGPAPRHFTETMRYAQHVCDLSGMADVCLDRLADALESELSARRLAWMQIPETDPENAAEWSRIVNVKCLLETLRRFTR